MRDVQLTATLIQRHVDQFLRPTDPPFLGDAHPPRMHQDIFAEVLVGQAEVDEGGAKGQGPGQLEEGDVVVMVICTETVMDVQSSDGDERFLIA